jgi:FtsH-binding integral membrane protein
VIQILGGLATHTLALLVYPGLLLMVLIGGAAELVWTRLTIGSWVGLQVPRRRPTPVVATVALCAMLSAVQLAAPLNPVPGDERNVVLAAVALAFTAWAALALTVEYVAEPGLLLVVQVFWLVAVLGPAVQPESLRPQVLGNLLVPGLLPAKVACAFLYLVCTPPLLRLWPLGSTEERRGRARVDAARMLCWFPYAGLFTTLFFTPSSDDAAGLVRFFGISLGVVIAFGALGLLTQRRGANLARGLYMRVVPPYAGLVLLIIVGTSILLR